MRARNWGTCTFLLYQTTGKFDTIPVISATTMEADHSWSSRSTPLNTSEKSDDSYGQPSDTETSPLLFNSNLSIGLTDKAPLLCNGTKATSITVLQSWKYVIAVVRGPQRLWSTTIAAIVAALSTLLSGYTLGYPSASLLQLNTLQDGFAIRNTSVLQDLFGALAPLGALFGGAGAGWTADLLGRKPTLLLSAVPNLIGWLLLALANYCTTPTLFKFLLLAGRFVTGVATGWSLLCAPVYIAEVAPAALRGLYSVLTQLALAFGILLVYCIGSIPGFSYNYVALVGVGMTAIFTFLMVFFPETPRFLLTKGNKDQASEVLRWLRGPKMNYDEEMIDMEIVLSQVKHMSCVECGRELARQSVCIPFALMVFVMMFQQFCGINALVFYAAKIFQSVGLGGSFIALFTIALTELVFTGVTAFTVDLIGRKVLLVLSGLVMAVSCFVLGSAFYLTHTYPHTSLQLLAVISAVVFIMGFALGWGGIPWTLVSELFPLRTRGFLAGVVSAINWTCGAIVTGFYFEYTKVVHSWGAWWTFGAVNLVAVVFVTIFVPETRGKPLEVIEQLMQHRYTLCSWK